MANRRQPLIPGWLWSGLLACGLLIVLAVLPLGALWQHAPGSSWRAIWHDRYLWHLIRFTFWQALLSTLFAVLPAILLARALWRCRFPGRQLLLRLCAMTMVLPVLVALFGILRIYGRQGWMAQLCQLVGIDYPFDPYGLQGVLLAHVFFNLPLASRLLLQALEEITTEQRQLAAQLGMNDWQHFRFVEWPYLSRQMLPVSALIFILCFTSFAILLTLGGGPAATTLALAIWQALSYEYDLDRAALLSLIQLVCCLGFVLFCQYFSPVLPPADTRKGHWRNPAGSLWQRVGDGLVVGATLLLLLPPLLAVMMAGFHQKLPETLQQPQLWQALLTSLIIALTAGLLCVILSMMLLWSSRELKLRQYLRWGQMFEMSGMLIFVMPGIVLATGLFLLLNKTEDLSLAAWVLVILINALMAVPYAMKILSNPMQDLAGRYTVLCLSLDIQGWHRLRWIELRALRRPLMQALAFGCVLSVGDFGVIALLGNEHFITLPLYLYQQIAAYRNHEGAVIALVLLLLCFLLFTLIDRLSGRHADT